MNLKYQIISSVSFCQTLKSSCDALDGLAGASRWGVIEAVLNSSFKKRHLQAKTNPRKLSHPKMFRNRPQTIFGDDFYTIPT